MNELREKLAERAGFIWIPDSKDEQWGIWQSPDGREITHDGLRIYHRDKYRYLPDFPNDLNACFKWLVPAGNIVGVTFHYFPGGTECEITVSKMAGFTNYRAWVDANSEKEAIEKSATALCKAVEQLIDNERK